MGEGSDEVGARDSKDAAKLTEGVEGGKMCPVIMKRWFFPLLPFCLAGFYCQMFFRNEQCKVYLTRSCHAAESRCLYNKIPVHTRQSCVLNKKCETGAQIYLRSQATKANTVIVQRDMYSRDQVLDTCPYKVAKEGQFQNHKLSGYISFTDRCGLQLTSHQLVYKCPTSVTWKVYCRSDRDVTVF